MTSETTWLRIDEHAAQRQASDRHAARLPASDHHAVRFPVTGEHAVLCLETEGQAAGWPAPLQHPSLPESEVHVWLGRVSATDSLQGRLFALLDADERERAKRFLFERDRRRHVAAHGLLRCLLARYSGEPAARLAFGFGEYGKPHVLARENRSNVEFSLSHAGDVVAIAVARSRAVGVDVEYRDPALEYDDVAKVAFSQAERAMLRVLPQSDKAAGFFAGWTRKEAYIKATGFGVSQGLAHFDVSLTPRNARLLADRRSAGARERWSMHDLALEADYSGAVVAAGRVSAVRCFSMTRIAQGCDA